MEKFYITTPIYYPSGKFHIGTAHGTTSIKYEIIDEKGPDHAKIFVSQVEWNGKKLAIGEGKSKKIAEMEAARKALEILK